MIQKVNRVPRDQAIDEGVLLPNGRRTKGSFKQVFKLSNPYFTITCPNMKGCSVQ